MDKILISWSDEYTLGFNKIDEQHKKLIDIINKLFNAFLVEEEKNDISEILNELLEYTVYHFKTEEDFFEKNNYPKIDIHKKEHLFFVKKNKSFAENYSKGDVNLTYTLMNFLKGWLLIHIQGSDKEYSTYFKEQGVLDI